MDKTMELLFSVVTNAQGAMTSALITLGDKLGLYRALKDSGPVTADELAGRTGLSPRWVREWLNQQGAAGLLAYRGDGRFEMTPEQAAILADEEGSPFYMSGMFAGIPTMFDLLPQITQSFRT